MITELLADNLKPGDHPLRVTNPDWAQVEKCLREMDGLFRTQVSLIVGEATGMLICGGPNGYTCEIITPHDHRQLVNPTGSRDILVTIAGMEESEEYFVVRLSEVLRAANRYWKTCVPDESLVWELNFGRPKRSGDT